MKRYSLLTLFLLPPTGVFAEQCKHCIDDKTIAAVVVIAILISLLVALVVALMISVTMNQFGGGKKKSFGLTYTGTVIGGYIGLFASFSAERLPVLLVTAGMFLGGFIGYSLVTKKKEPDDPAKPRE